MKKFVFFFLISWVVSTLAQSMAYTEIKGGIFDPQQKGAKSGFIFSYGTGKTIDEAFSWMIDFSLYAKNYTSTAVVDTLPGNQFDEFVVVKDLEISTYLLPVLLKITFDKKIAPRSPLVLKGSAGLGYQFLWNREMNYIEKEKKSRFYHGFTYEFSLGAGLHMSSSAILFAEIFYHGGKVKRNRSTTEEGLPTWNEVDMSGKGIRIGINFVNFGLFK